MRRPDARTAAAGSILVLRGHRAARAAPAGGIKATLECRAAGAAHQAFSRAPLARRPAVPVKPDVIQTLSRLPAPSAVRGGTQRQEASPVASLAAAGGRRRLAAPVASAAALANMDLAVGAQVAVQASIRLHRGQRRAPRVAADSISLQAGVLDVQTVLRGDMHPPQECPAVPPVPADGVLDLVRRPARRAREGSTLRPDRRSAQIAAPDGTLGKVRPLHVGVVAPGSTLPVPVRLRALAVGAGATAQPRGARHHRSAARVPVGSTAKWGRVRVGSVPLVRAQTAPAVRPRRVPTVTKGSTRLLDPPRAVLARLVPFPR